MAPDAPAVDALSPATAVGDALTAKRAVWKHRGPAGIDRKWRTTNDTLVAAGVCALKPSSSLSLLHPFPRHDAILPSILHGQWYRTHCPPTEQMTLSQTRGRSQQKDILAPCACEVKAPFDYLGEEHCVGCDNCHTDMPSQLISQTPSTCTRAAAFRADQHEAPPRRARAGAG